MNTFVMIMVLKLYGYAPSMAAAEYNTEASCIAAGQKMQAANKNFEFVCTAK